MSGSSRDTWDAYVKGSASGYNFSYRSPVEVPQAPAIQPISLPSNQRGTKKNGLPPLPIGKMFSGGKYSGPLGKRKSKSKSKHSSLSSKTKKKRRSY